MFLPWNRQFLRHVEQAIQNFDCSVTIPYYDWAVDSGKPYKSLVWAANIMGGNGGLDGCVRYHPFKSYHPSYLFPCLRRNFNTSVSLPSVVNIELALRETSYDKFRLQMEYFTRLYQSFVGGHLDSDLAPYDPLFYSVMAFVDKLWTEWQERHPDGLLSFPLDVRYSIMEPFKSTPDDVFDSRLKVCVEYDDVPCNSTDLPFYGYDSRGYDRHGYNRQGYDKDGYNISGFDCSGNPDTRGFYNLFGFNREGFGRSGFDASGIDQFGFFEDSYNLDDFDAQGYDRSGLNRYGFNQYMVTPFGYQINGTFTDDKKMFDVYGYNKYGFNKEGFDRSGYDIFGFNSMGYDIKMCNFFFIGPIHILVKHYVSKTLRDLNITIITRIKRVCQPVSPPYEHFIHQYWLDRNNQRSRLNEIYQYHVQTHSFDPLYTPRTTSVTSDLLWLPVAPDDR